MSLEAGLKLSLSILFLLSAGTLPSAHTCAQDRPATGLSKIRSRTKMASSRFLPNLSRWRRCIMLVL